MTESFEWMIDDKVKKAFHSVQEVVDFIAKHQEFYSWVSSQDLSVRSFRDGLETSVWTPLIALVQAVNRWREASPLPDFPRDNFEQVFRHRKLPIIGSPSANVIENLRHSEGVDAAVGALSVFVNAEIRPTNGQAIAAKSIRGIVVVSNFLDGLPRDGYEPRKLLET